MKIVCIAASFIPSNTANSIQVMKVSHALAEIGHDVTLLVPGDQGIPWEDLQQHYGVQQAFDIQWISENLTFRRYDFALKALREAVRMKPDIIYTWVLQAAVLALWHKLPTILEMHDRVTGKLGPWLFRQFWRSETPKRLLTITEALKNVLISDFESYVEKDQILVTHNGVDIERYQGQPKPEIARQQLDLALGFTAGYTGHFYAGRGMDLMFSLAKSLPEINFLWVGGEPSDVMLWRKRLQDAQVKNVTLTGFVSNEILPNYQAACDVLLMPYSYKIAGSGGGNSAEIASPMKMFEYIAAGRAIISSDLPVIHEVLDDQTAIFCAPEDFNAWRNALLALKSDPVRRESLAQNARAMAATLTWRAREQKALQDFLR